MTTSSSSSTPPSPSTKCSERALVDQHFAGTISPDDERRMREHIRDCAACHKYYRRHLMLAQLDPDALPTEERIGRGLGVPAKNAPARARIVTLFPVVASALAVAAVLFFVLRSPRSVQTSDLDPGFASRGGGSSSLLEPGPVGVYLASPTPGQPMTPAPSSVKIDDALAFTYRNLDAKTHLMIFGVDERGRVFWFYPAWTDASESPSAIPIATDTSTHELREAVRHRFEGEHLEVHGLFVDRPITVHDAEAAVKRRSTPTGPVELAGAIDHVTTFATRR